MTRLEEAVRRALAGAPEPPAVSVLGYRVRRRRRARGLIAGVVVLAVVVLTIVIASSATGKNHAQVVVSPTTEIALTTTTTSATTTSRPALPATAPGPRRALVTPPTASVSAVGAGGSTPPTAATSPWHVSATSGLTNLAPVTISAVGIAAGSYDVGQCPAGQPPNPTTCVLNDVVTVRDGTITSTVHVFWWLQNGRIDCGSAPGMCVVGVMNAQTAVTVVSFPISFDPARRPTITVSPDASLVDGQSVVVHGVDVGEGTMQIEECLLPQWASCTAVDVQSQPDGTFSTPMTVHRQLEWGGLGSGSGTCGVDGNCVLEVWMTSTELSSDRIWINPDQPVALNFAPATTTPPTS